MLILSLASCILLLTSVLAVRGAGVVKALNLDYSRIAKEAEGHGGNILKFLNQSKVQTQYKTLYRSLLRQMTDQRQAFQQTLPNTRRDSYRRIVSGHNTSIFAVPWQASLRTRSYPICGGSVVTDIWIITAAHCLVRNKAADLSVRLGSSWKLHGGEMYDVKEAFHHPKYFRKTKANDVGLVKLYTPLRFSARVLPIHMIEKQRQIRANATAIVSGWGKLKEGGPSASFLQSSMVNMIAMKLCKQTGLDRKAIDPHTMFCAGSFGPDSPDACQGDSGGPIVSEGVLIGIVSWGLGCARGNFPGVYTRLTNPVIWEWVNNHIRKPFDSKVVSL